MLRFSYSEVPDGYVPSAGSALTGSSSPRPASIAAVTVRTNSGAPRNGGLARAAPVLGSSPAGGTSTWCSPATAASTAALFRATISGPRRP